MRLKDAACNTVVTLVAFAPRILDAPHSDRLGTMVLDGDLKPATAPPPNASPAT